MQADCLGLSCENRGTCVCVYRVSRPVSCSLKNVFFVDFNLARNEAPEGGGREELLLESQEGQELSAGAAARQLVLNMSSEHQTVDHTYMIMGNDHDTIFIDFSEYAGQEDTNFENSAQRVNDCVQTPRYVHFRSHKL